MQELTASQQKLAAAQQKLDRLAGNCEQMEQEHHESMVCYGHDIFNQAVQQLHGTIEVVRKTFIVPQKELR